MKALGLHTLPLAKISLGLRLRVVDENHAAHLAENIAEVGRLRSPVEVREVKGPGGRKTYTVIAGGHRFRAVQMLGWTEIDAFVFEMTEAEARIWEIDENIRRHELNPLDRAVFLAERQRLYLELHPETAAGVAGGKARQGTATDTMSFATDVAKRCGLTERTIQRAITIARNIAPAIRQRIAGTPLAAKQSELLALAKATPAEQSAAITLILDGAAKTVDAALKQVRGVREAADPDADTALSKLLRAWKAAPPHVKRGFLAAKMEDATDDVLRDFVAAQVKLREAA